MDSKKVVKAPGRKPFVNPDEVFAILNSRIDRIFTNEGQLQPISSEIWKMLSTDLGHRITANSLYISVYQNRYSWQSKLKAIIGLHFESNIKDSDINSDVSENSSDSIKSKTKKKLFNFLLSYKHFLKIKPAPREYKDKNRTRVYNVLEAGKWTDIVYDKFFKKFRLPCNFIFKRGKVARDHSSASKYIQFWGSCKDCSNELKGWCDRKPYSGEPLKINISTNDTRDNTINHISKRPLKGYKRRKIGKQLTTNLASNWRRENAGKSMIFGEKSPPNLYNYEVLRKTKQEIKDKDLGITVKCPLMSLVELKRNSSFSNDIHAIGIDPVFVHYWTMHQIIIYKDCAKTYFRLAIDATGSIIKKIKRSTLNVLSGDIFLYEAVINTGYGQIPVSQMVSERHDTLTIHYWLGQWLKSSLKIPNEVNCDFSKALLGAISITFCGMSLQDYLETCYKVLTDQAIELPRTYIRIDVSHMIKIFCRTKCLIGHKRRILKEFYVRCLRLLLTSKDLDTFTKFLDAIFTVTLSETDGDYEETRTPSELSRQYLLDCMKGLSKDDPFEENDPAVKTDTIEDNTLDEEASTGCINEFISAILNSSTMKATVTGNRISAYYLPELVPHIIRWCRDFPLWTSVMLHKYNSPYDIATSAPVEGDFNTLKNQILRFEQKPMSIDRFVIRHLKSIDGSTKIMRSSQVKNKCLQLNEILKKNSEDDSVSLFNSNTSKNIFLDKSSDELKEDTKDTGFELNRKSFTNDQSCDDQCAVITKSKRYQKIFLDVSSPEKSSQNYGNFDNSSDELKEDKTDTGFELNRKSFTYDQSCDDQCAVITKSKRYQKIFLDVSSPEKCSQNYGNFDNSSDELKEDKTDTGFELNRKSFTYDQSCDDQCAVITKSKKYQKIFLDVSSPEKSSQNYGNFDNSSDELKEDTKDTGFELNRKSFTNDQSCDDQCAVITKSKRYQKIFLDVSSPEKSSQNYGNFDNSSDELKEDKTDTGFELNRKSFTYDQSCDDQCAVITKSKKYQKIFLDVSSPEKSSQNYNDFDSLTNVISKELDINILEQETWRGLGGNPNFELDTSLNIITKKRKNRPGKYMTDVPEIDRILNSRKLRSNMNTVLRNGNSCTPIQLYKKRFIVRNTCPFDSVAIIIVMAYYDNHNYKCYLDNCENLFINFCKDLALGGPSKTIYKERAAILKDIFEDATGISGVGIIDTTCNIAYIINKLLKDAPSATESLSCSNENCTNNKSYSNPTIITKFNGGFSSMESTIMAYLDSRNFDCTALHCNGNIIAKRKLHNHLFIETEVFANTLQYSLTTFPTTLNIEESKYQLNGIVGYRSGHYTAYIMRASESWEHHNDLAKKILKIKNPKQITIEPHIIVYTKEN